MTPSDTEPVTRFFDLSGYTSKDLVHLWSSKAGLENQALLAASLVDETTSYTVLARMVDEPMDVLTGDNVNWTMVDVTEDVLISIIPLVDVSQSGGALLVLGWIQWVNGRLDLAMESFQRIEEDTDFRSSFTSVVSSKVANGIQPACVRSITK
jgi:hypothetical protein